jgi:hypothetical protein
MIDFTQVKLGKNAPRVDIRTLRMSKYTDSAPPPPDMIDYQAGITDWGEMLNMTLGDCTIAGCGHAVQTWDINTDPSKGLTVFSDGVIESYYSNWDGYVAGDPSTDNGGVELDVLNNWRQSGFDGHQLLAFMAVSPLNPIHVKQAIYLFGGTYIGIELPLTAQGQNSWTLVPVNDGTDTPGSWGGHCVWVLGYYIDPATGILMYKFISWGQVMTMTLPFFVKYVSEAYALLSQDWVASGVAPNTFNQAQLLQDLQSVTVN